MTYIVSGVETSQFCCGFACHAASAVFSASEMTYIVSSGALNSTHSLTSAVFIAVTNSLGFVNGKTWSSTSRCVAAVYRCR